MSEDFEKALIRGAGTTVRPAVDGPLGNVLGGFAIRLDRLANLVQSLEVRVDPVLTEKMDAKLPRGISASEKSAGLPESPFFNEIRDKFVGFDCVLDKLEEILGRLHL